MANGKGKSGRIDRFGFLGLQNQWGSMGTETAAKKLKTLVLWKKSYDK